MKERLVIAALALALPGGAIALQGDGPLEMMQVGRYDCELPGPPPLLTPQPQPGDSFTITGSTSYRAADGASGHYLYSQGVLVMTSGPMRGARFTRRSDSRFQRAGGSAPLRCLRSPGSVTDIR